MGIKKILLIIAELSFIHYHKIFPKPLFLSITFINVGQQEPEIFDSHSLRASWR